MADDAGSPPPSPEDGDGDEIITLREAADRFGVSTTELRRLARAGDLPGASTRPTPSGGVEWVVPASSAQSVAASQQAAGEADPFGSLRTFEEPPPRRNTALIGLIVLLAGLVLAGTAVWLSGDDGGQETANDPTTTSADPEAQALAALEAVIQEEVPEGQPIGTLGSAAEDLAGRYRPTVVLPSADAPPAIVVIAGDLTEEEQAAADTLASAGQLLTSRDDVVPALEVWRVDPATATTATTATPSTEATTTSEAPNEATTTTEATTTSAPSTTTTVPETTTTTSRDSEELNPSDPAKPGTIGEEPSTSIDGTRVVKAGESFW